MKVKSPIRKQIKNVNGIGVAKDDVKAFEWYMNAAAQEHVWGQLSVGWMYYIGKSVPRDIERAKEYFKEAEVDAADYDKLDSFGIKELFVY